MTKVIVTILVNRQIIGILINLNYRLGKSLNCLFNMGILKQKQVGDKVKFKHRFAREKDFTILGGTIVQICDNGVDCYIKTIDQRKYCVGEWLIVE